MIDLAITSILFLFCLTIGPLLMAQNLLLRRWSFLIVCLCLFLLSLNNLESLAAITIFVLFPYFYLYIVRRWNAPLWPAILIQIMLLIYINKYTWIISFFGIPIPFFITLVGVSYIFFRQLDVLFQVKAELVQSVPLIDYLNYLLSFWTILAGPIQRYREFIKEFYSKKERISDDIVLSCLHRASSGLIKILIIAPFFYGWFNYNELMNESDIRLRLLLILYTYPIYLYFNFSGYCDVVIAMARWAGFKIPENFNKPYLARDMIDMWNRWNITLSQWLRDYLYQPLFKWLLTGPCIKKIAIPQYISIFITFFSIGIWHGTTISYILFGILQGTGMAVSMIYRDTCKKYLGKERYTKYYANRFVAGVEWFVTMQFWCFTLLFFAIDIEFIKKSLLAVIGLQ